MSHNVQLLAKGFCFTDQEMESVPRVGDRIEHTEDGETHEFEVAAVLWTTSVTNGDQDHQGVHLRLTPVTTRWDDLG